MPLDLNVFRKNQDFIIRAADQIEAACRQAHGYELTECPDDLLKESADGVGRTMARAIYEYLQLKKNGDTINEHP